MPNEKYKNVKFCENLKIWLEILLKIKPNEKCENLNFSENLHRKHLLKEIPFNLTFLHFHQKLNSPSILQKKST